MIKKILITLISSFVILWLSAPSILGFSIWNLGHAVGVATGMSAKLACSAYFVSGFDKQLIVSDLASYSPAARVVDLKYDEKEKSVTASLFGLATTSARYNAKTGCSLDYGQMLPKGELAVNKIEDNWPVGDYVSTIAPRIQQEAEAILRSDNEKGLNSRAILVVHDGQVIAEAYANNISSDTKLLGWSMAKSVTAIMLGNLEYQGLIARDSNGLFPQWSNDQRAELTLEQLLNMSSGLEFDETYAPGSDATHMLFTAKSASDIALTSALTKQPDSYFSYSSGTTNLLSRLIKQTLQKQGLSDVEYLENTFFKPLGMSNSVFEQDASGVFVGSSYLYASARDWAKWGLLMLNKGQLNGKQFLSEQWVTMASTPNKSDNEKAYGYQFWLNRGDEKLRWPQLPEDAFTMQGNRSQSIMMIPSKNVVFVRLGWTAGKYPMAQNYAQLLEKIVIN